MALFGHVFMKNIFSSIISGEISFFLFFALYNRHMLKLFKNAKVEIRILKFL